MLIRLLLCATALVFSLASASSRPLALKNRFDHTGEYTGTASATPIVGTAEEVKVFYASAPPGFTLRENELKVEPGYTHRILGTVRTRYTDGDCRLGTKADVVRSLREAAFANGGNAVIYVHSALGDAPTAADEMCLAPGEEDYGGGWVVVLEDASSRAPAQADAPTPAPAPPAAPVEHTTSSP